jgi:hypothetical protein
MGPLSHYYTDQEADTINRLVDLTIIRSEKRRMTHVGLTGQEKTLSVPTLIGLIQSRL